MRLAAHSAKLRRDMGKDEETVSSIKSMIAVAKGIMSPGLHGRLKSLGFADERRDVGMKNPIG